ncbi:MAG: hypothetical protein GC205_01795 [Bacteroidetes bacterium]|nr:hypothetical protein [Bacteroidota bacterium]
MKRLPLTHTLAALAMFFFAVLAMPSCNPSSAAKSSASPSTEQARTSTGEGLALAPRMGANVQGVFMKKRLVGGKYFYEYPALAELGITMTRGISGSGSTFSRYGDPALDPAYAGHGWTRAAADYPAVSEAQKAGQKRSPESNNHYRDWLNMVQASPAKDLVVVANPYMPFSELAAFLDDAEAAGARVLWLEAGNEMNSPSDLKAWQEQLAARDPGTARYDARTRVEKAFALYWDWVRELEDFAQTRKLPLAYVGPPPAYAFPDMLDPETMGDKANLGQKKALSDRIFNEIGSDRVRRGLLAGAGISRHRYSQWDIEGKEMQERNDDLSRKLSYPLSRNYYSELKETEVDFYRSLYPNAKILLTEWALRKSGAGAGYSMAACYDVAKTLIAMGQINAAYRENVVELVTFQNLYAEKMGGLIYYEGNTVGLSPEGRAYRLFTVMDGRPILEVGKGDNIETQWLRVQGVNGQAIVYYNRSSAPFKLPFSGEVHFLQSDDILGEPETVQVNRADGSVPANSVGVLYIQ